MVDSEKDEAMTCEDACEGDLRREEAPEPSDKVCLFSSMAFVGGLPVTNEVPKVVGGKTPAFSLKRYTMSVAAGLKRKKEQEDEERSREKKKWEEYRGEGAEDCYVHHAWTGVSRHGASNRRGILEGDYQNGSAV